MNDQIDWTRKYDDSDVETETETVGVGDAHADGAVRLREPQPGLDAPVQLLFLAPQRARLLPRLALDPLAPAAAALGRQQHGDAHGHRQQDEQQKQRLAAAQQRRPGVLVLALPGQRALLRLREDF